MSDLQTVITIGNFDGVHIGHQSLIARAREMADAAAIQVGEARGHVVAMSFTAHPLTEIKPEMAPPVLSTPKLREAGLKAYGVDEVVWLNPNKELLSQEPEQFVMGLLKTYPHLVGIVEGPDFRFGKNRRGDISTLRAIGAEHGYQVHILDEVTVTLRDKQVCRVSSTLVRWLLAHGRVNDVRLSMGHAFALQGTVVKGEQRGRTIGFPTANLDFGQLMTPAHGVYATRVTIHAENGEPIEPSYTGATSIGIKPTFQGKQRVVETHLLDFDQDIYGRTITVEFLRWVRGQVTFSGIEDLIAQIQRDIAKVREWDALGVLDPMHTIVSLADNDPS